MSATTNHHTHKHTKMNQLKEFTAQNSHLSLHRNLNKKKLFVFNVDNFHTFWLSKRKINSNLVCDSNYVELNESNYLFH